MGRYNTLLPVRMSKALKSVWMGVENPDHQSEINPTRLSHRIFSQFAKTHGKCSGIERQLAIRQEPNAFE